ncbi:peptide chain release factor N(5)-glutamine methyltransferase [uncultured Clostridium sp.]|jgi:release factor-specific protein-(glutamine-N5) methyltransferase|uniref:peptide chain release factor N(5)-glutamine methyltransferase n=1 Tax=uncultured Clostridium sp. TaxID=59620 RepID=UPI002635901B|nr:peptide chain release factor N(5)-glutamine methyltransferase [uncultured Clostridium sp.]
MDDCRVGGQGLLDGVMMNGKKGIATAIRMENNSIDLRFERRYRNQKETGLRSLPFFRGILIILDAVKSGIKGFDLSEDIVSDILSKDILDPLQKILNTTKSNISRNLVMGLASFIAMFAFMILPSVIIYFFKDYIGNNIILGVLEGIATISILLLYMYTIGKSEEISTMFAYHGAEHKSIFCYEKGHELNIENVKKEKRFHLRCGTNLLFMMLINCSIIYIFLGWNSIIIRILLKISIIPIVAGISYELVEYTTKSNSIISKIIAWPGLKLQLLTTKEPDESQIEVAILALKKAEGLKVEKTIRELLNEANQIFKTAGIDSYILDAQLLMCYVLKENKLWLMTNAFERIGMEKEEEFCALVEKRKNKYPINYILGNVEFMGIEFIVKDGVLIPRPDTEVLVEEVLKYIEKYEELDICDLCCGSGAIGISIAQYRINTKVDLLDIDSIPEEVTRLNIENQELEGRTKFIHSDLFANASNKGYDIIVSNPPYIREEVIETLMDDVKNYEPHLALSGGEDGLVFYRKIIEESSIYLKGKKILAFEIGYDQGEEVKLLMENSNFENVRIIKDLAGLNRVVIGNLIIE